jgi:hypothetical protein
MGVSAVSGVRPFGTLKTASSVVLTDGAPASSVFATDGAVGLSFPGSQLSPYDGGEWLFIQTDGPPVAVVISGPPRSDRVSESQRPTGTVHA